MGMAKGLQTEGAEEVGDVGEVPESGKGKMGGEMEEELGRERGEHGENGAGEVSSRFGYLYLVNRDCFSSLSQFYLPVIQNDNKM